ncbi:substrate-binding periplasmic protein [Roseibium denhamense]|uniref:Extracellular solute-binding protein, family 3 n=1 Tax=Roseibium denhamense TaxID=76305 RepID=A0ABY1PAC9_9HYPH|nr:transporter substrate-binding domain-containing protein [Roseibium denhamense]SMP29922.1 extracellular solute-binding protein, family 3 [Roseibium denhamense]
MFRLSMSVIALFAIVLIGNSTSQAEQITIVTGEWVPYTGSRLPEGGPYAKKVAEVFDRVGSDVKFEFYPWKRTAVMVENGQMIAAMPFVKTPERVERFLFPDTPVVTQRLYVYFRKDRFPNGIHANSFQSLKDQDIRLVSVLGYSQTEAMKKLGGVVEEVATEDLAWKVLLAGRVDAFTSVEGAADVTARAALGNRYDEIGRSSKPFYERDLFVVFSKNHPRGLQLLKQWDAAFANCIVDTTVEESGGDLCEPGIRY